MVSKLPSMVVSAVTTFDGKALTKGSKQISAFEKGAKRLGATFAAAFSVQKIAQFGKAAVKAFVDDEKAASRLALSVKNLGLAFETPRIEEFISQLSRASGVTDDQLRPSMQKLLQTTGSVAKSTELLTQALDISAGSGVDYETVVNDLSMAYVGQTRGLRKYSLGLTQAELKTMSFADIQEKLTKQFTGANSQYLTTYAGKMGILSNAAGEASENIGKGLIESLTLLAGEGQTIQPLADSMLEFSTEISNAITGIAVLINKIKGIPGIDFLARNQGTILDILPNTGIIKKAFKGLSDLGKQATPGMGGYPSSALGGTFVDPNEAARKKAEAAAAKRAKEIAAAAAKAAKAEKQKLALTKAAAVFDTTRISLAAALKATYDKDTKLRLEALMLIEEDRGDEALKKIDELAKFQKNADMQRLAGVETISNATLESLNKQLITELKVINDSKMAEGDKELAREEAFKKYNAAITAAGKLAATESYNERVQIQLTEIARLASISKTTSAATTANLLLESSELSMIDRVAKAQATADAARMKALMDYNNALNRTGTGSDFGGNKLGSLVPNFVPPQWAQDLAAGVIAGVNPGFVGPIPTLNQPSANYGYNPTMGFPGQSVEVTINAGVGDPEAIARAVEDVLNQSTYRGTSVNRGAGNYVL